MKSKDIVFAAMEMKDPERVPVAPFGSGVWTIHRSGTTFRELSTDADRMAKTNIDIYNKFKPDIVYVGSGFNNLHAAALGGTIVFREIGAPDLENPYIAELADIEKLDLNKIPKDQVIQTIWEAARKVKAEIGNDVVVTITAWGPFTLAAQLVGVETFMRSTFKNKDLVKATCEFASEMIKRVFEPLIDDGTVDLLSLADPVASGDLVSRKQFERFAIPPLKLFTEWAHKKGKKVLLHICGDTNNRLDLFPETGADCISLDHKVDLAQAKIKIGNKICIAGNLDPVSILDRATVDDVKKLAYECLDAGAGGGGFILMPGCDHPPSVPDDNLRAFYDSARNYKSSNDNC